MEGVVSIIGSALVTFLSFMTQRMIKNIDKKFAHMDKRFEYLSHRTNEKLDEYLKEVDSLKKDNENLMRELAEKNLRHAKLLAIKIEALKDMQDDKAEKYYGKVIMLESNIMSHKEELESHGKKIQILHTALRKKK